jgi:ribulose kinase
MTLPRNGRSAVTGIDFGTLSGRAVVVSVDNAAHRAPAPRRKAGRN